MTAGRAERRLAALGLAAVVFAVLAVVHTGHYHAGDLLQALLTGDLSALRPEALVLVTLCGLAAVAALRATTSLARALAAQRRITAALSGAPERVVPGGRVRVLDDDRPMAFCIGVVRPSVVVSRGALDRVAPDALAAILAHEREHARRRDGLRRMLARAASAGAIGARTVHDLADAAASEAELAADRRAVAEVGRAQLAGAMVAVAGDRIAAERVDQLLGRPLPAPPPVPLLVPGCFVAAFASGWLGLHVHEPVADLAATAVAVTALAVPALLVRPALARRGADLYDPA
jgi:Zn-dependent protease with chaperone function